MSQHNPSKVIFYSPKLEDVTWIWANDWWDGVLAGVVEWHGKRYYADHLEENEENNSWYRRFVVIDLPEDVWKEEIEKHNLFVEKVGSHFDYKDGKRCGEVKPQAMWNEYYDKYPPHNRERNYTRFRKKCAFGCSNPRCIICHGEKYPKRELTIQETKANLKLKEYLKESKNVPYSKDSRRSSD